MKFLCDRCKTRYSIGDDRVRGKILKIRCKNCNNVVTVREGMPDADTVDPSTRGRSLTQAVPLIGADQVSGPNGVISTSSGPGIASGPVSGSVKPPSALEEEWYVSIDGDQSGPFSLAEAQRWVAGKAVDADLHCWREGFDDWLPVDKVSHFRGLRKKPAPALAPPPLPRMGSGPMRPAARAAPVEEEPKALFAATMASIEKSADTSAPAGLGMPVSPASPASSRPVAQPMAARANGSVAPLGGSLSKASTSRPVFDANESATQLQAPVFENTPHEPTDPATGRGKADANDAFAKAMSQHGKPDARKPASLSSPSLPVAAAPIAKPEIADGDFDGDGDLDIGEVSRVVKLADLMKPARRSQPIPVRTGAIPRIGGTQPMMRVGGSTQPMLPISAETADGLPPDQATADASVVLPGIPAAVAHRRHMIALVVGALVLLGIAGGVVLMVTSSDDSLTGGLGGGVDYDTTRPDDPIRRGSDNVAMTPTPPQNPFVPKRPTPRPSNPIVNPTNTNPDAKALRPDEIEEMAAKYSGTTQRCYVRSQRGAESILLADVKKLGVTLTVDKDGTVTNVQLSDHATSSLGKCLISSIRSWKFRSSSSGITAKITMVFQSG
ncbi:MAG: zinc-ribbon domain-containing protein [Deltaproteobacteria bacterium]|nr:zinc-ribbon domain-containing protein [Deltaproteobacteria bacterium]MDQ3298870.1 zinc-ribbon domain-containing protein [Myxococcota bacterium]